MRTALLLDGGRLPVMNRRSYLGSDNPKWRGNAAGYVARHVRVRTARGKASTQICERCGDPAFEWAHLHDTDPFDVQNYIPLCVKCHRAYDNPAHLRGERHPLAKLTEDDVREIRQRFADGEMQKVLAAEFGVLQGTISKIVLRAIWKEVMPYVVNTASDSSSVS